MTFGKPHLLWLLLLLPALAALVWWSWRVKQKTMTRFIAGRLLDSLTVGLSKMRQKIRAALLLGAVALVLFSLSQPRWGFDLEEARQRGLDLVVAIDTSKSMLADDLQPNRLARAKLAALDLMKLARTDRLGLVAFAGSAFLQCPLSLDEEAFRQSVESLDVTIIPQGGTALSEAIQTALSAFKENTENHKILVLFTDGEDNDEEGSAASAARNSAKEGLRIFTIGVGTPNGELLATRDPYGNRVFIKDAQGNVVKSRLNEALLQQLAKETEGFYLPLSGARTMEVLYERGLAPLPKAEFAAKTIRRYHERYQWFLGAAIVLLLAEMFFPERRKSPKSKVQGPKSATAVAAVLLASATVAFASTGSALKDYERGKFAKARQEFERLARKSPEDARLRYNAGAAAFRDEDYDSALKHFSASLFSPDLTLQEQSYYNLGNTQFRLGEGADDPKEKSQHWEQAVHQYENALKLNPADEDAKFNLEVVKKKLEELKKQQEQQQQQNKQDQQDKKDDQQKQDQQKQQEQEKKDQQSEQEKKDEQQSKQEQQQQEQQNQEQQGKEQEKKEQEAQQQQAQDQRGESGKESEQQAAMSKVMQMTPQQAQQLLEALKADEKTMIFLPQNVRTNRNPNRVFKDW